MKGLAITILLLVLELSALSAGSGDLLSNGPEPIPSIRREESQSDMLVEAERLEVAVLEPAVHAADAI
jgi:hypothetical protein